MDVLLMEERKAAREASEAEQVEVPVEEEEPEPTPPVKKPKRAPAGKAAKATPARSVTTQPQCIQVQPPPQASEHSLQEGRTASEDTKEEEEEGEEEKDMEEEEVGDEEGADAAQEVEIPTPQSKKPGVKRKLDVSKPPLPVKAKPATAGSKTRTKGEQSKAKKPTVEEKGKSKEIEPSPMEEDPERTETVDSSKSEDILAPNKPVTSTIVTKVKKRKGLVHPPMSEPVIPKDSQRYAVLMNRDITPWYFLLTEILEEFGIKERVEGYFQGIGWKSVLEWNYLPYKKLSEEFTSTVEFKPKGNYTIETPGTLRFQLRGRMFPLSINELNIHLGVVEPKDVYDEEYKQAETIASPEWKSQIDLYWSQISTGTKYVKNSSKSNEIRDPALQIYHRWLAYNIYGRLEGSNVVTQQEVFLLWCMTEKRRVNFGFTAALQFQYGVTHTNKYLSLCPLVTILAKKLTNFNDESPDEEPVAETHFLDTGRLLRWKIIEANETSGYCLVYPEGSSVRPEQRAVREQGAPRLTIGESAAVMAELKEVKEEILMLSAEMTMMREAMEAGFKAVMDRLDVEAEPSD